MEQFQEKVNELFAKHETLLSRKNIPLEDGNGIFTRYQHPVLTAAHTPIFWRYDLNDIIRWWETGHAPSLQLDMT